MRGRFHGGLQTWKHLALHNRAFSMRSESRLNASHSLFDPITQYPDVRLELFGAGLALSSF